MLEPGLDKFSPTALFVTRLNRLTCIASVQRTLQNDRYKENKSKEAKQNKAVPAKPPPGHLNMHESS
jgi:hypothetical protein